MPELQSSKPFIKGAEDSVANDAEEAPSTSTTWTSDPARTTQSADRSRSSSSSSSSLSSSSSSSSSSSKKTPPPPPPRPPAPPPPPRPSSTASGSEAAKMTPVAGSSSSSKSNSTKHPTKDSRQKSKERAAPEPTSRKTPGKKKPDSTKQKLQDPTREERKATTTTTTTPRVTSLSRNNNNNNKSVNDQAAAQPAVINRLTDRRMSSEERKRIAKVAAQKLLSASMKATAGSTAATTSDDILPDGLQQQQQQQQQQLLGLSARNLSFRMSWSSSFSAKRGGSKSKESCRDLLTLACHNAVAQGQLSLVKVLLKTGRVPQVDKAGNTPLHLAARFGRLKCLRWLQQHVTSIPLLARNARGETCVHVAALYGNLKCLQVILAAPQSLAAKLEAAAERDQGGMTCLHLATLQKREDVVSWLASTFGRDLCLVKSDWGGNLAIHLAAACGYQTCIEILVEVCTQSVNMRDAFGATAVSYAAQAGHLNVLRFLVEDANASLGVSHGEGTGGGPGGGRGGGGGGIISPFLAAAEAGHVEILQYIVDREGKDVLKTSSVRDGTTALHFAAANGHVSVLQYLMGQCRPGGWGGGRGRGGGAAVTLLSLGQQGNAMDRTPAHLAALNGHAHCLQLLVEAGLSVYLPDKDGETAISLAMRSSNPQCVMYARALYQATVEECNNSKSCKKNLGSKLRQISGVMSIRALGSKEENSSSSSSSSSPSSSSRYGVRLRWPKLFFRDKSGSKKNKTKKMGQRESSHHHSHNHNNNNNSRRKDSNHPPQGPVGGPLGLEDDDGEFFPQTAWPSWHESLISRSLPRDHGGRGIFRGEFILLRSSPPRPPRGGSRREDQDGQGSGPGQGPGPGPGVTRFGPGGHSSCGAAPPPRPPHHHHHHHHQHQHKCGHRNRPASVPLRRHDHTPPWLRPHTPEDEEILKDTVDRLLRQKTSLDAFKKHSAQGHCHHSQEPSLGDIREEEEEDEEEEEEEDEQDAVLNRLTSYMYSPTIYSCPCGGQPSKMTLPFSSMQASMSTMGRRISTKSGREILKSSKITLPPVKEDQQERSSLSREEYSSDESGISEQDDHSDHEDKVTYVQSSEDESQLYKKPSSLTSSDSVFRDSDNQSSLSSEGEGVHRDHEDFREEEEGEGCKETSQKTCSNLVVTEVLVHSDDCTSLFSVQRSEGDAGSQFSVSGESSGGLSDGHTSSAHSFSEEHHHCVSKPSSSKSSTSNAKCRSEEGLSVKSINSSDVRSDTSGEDEDPQVQSCPRVSSLPSLSQATHFATPPQLPVPPPPPPPSQPPSPPTLPVSKPRQPPVSPARSKSPESDKRRSAGPEMGTLAEVLRQSLNDGTFSKQNEQRRRHSVSPSRLNVCHPVFDSCSLKHTGTRSSSSTMTRASKDSRASRRYSAPASSSSTEVIDALDKLIEGGKEETEAPVTQRCSGKIKALQSILIMQSLPFASSASEKSSLSPHSSVETLYDKNGPYAASAPNSRLSSSINSISSKRLYASDSDSEKASASLCAMISSVNQQGYRPKYCSSEETGF